MSRSVGLILPLADNFEQHDAYIGVDKGSIHLLNKGIVPILCVGDFDSCTKSEVEQIKQACPMMLSYPSEKDDTDTSLAIQETIKQGYDTIVLYGGLQGRFDHTLANFNLLYHYDSLILMDSLNKVIKLKKGCHQLLSEGYTYLSFFFYQDTHLSLKGVKYPLNHQLLKAYDSLAISNQFIENKAYIECDQDIICIMSKDE
ncbi:MAG: thiamine diphosphokinase [Erysipelotrichaceae bacterium]